MIRDVVELEGRFQQLKSSRSALAAEMHATATSLRASGTLPSPDLDRSLSDYREQYGHLRSTLGIISLESEPASDSIWAQFDARLAICRQAAEATRKLQQIERLRIPVGSEATLAPIRQSYHDIHARLLKTPWDEQDLIEDVLTARHPLCHLLSLVIRLYDLTDDEWTTEMGTIQKSFGIAVATAIARGKVTLEEDFAEI